MEERNNIGRNRLIEAMKARNMTAADLCRRTGIPTSSMSRYITGNSVPKQNSLATIADALNVNPAWLMGYDTEKEPNGDLWLEAERILVEIDGLSPDNIERLKQYARKLKEIQDKKKKLEDKKKELEDLEKELRSLEGGSGNDL